MTQLEPRRAAGTTVGAPVACVLFDMSGVLVDFRGAHALGRLIGAPEQEVWPRWLESPWMRRFDAGACSPEEFADGIVQEWKLKITAAEFLAAFTDWMVGPYDGATELVAQTRTRAQVGCLSNMNPLHWHELEHWPLAAGFDHRFISCEIGLVKPDRELYEYAVKRLQLDPASILFLDDNVPNVQAAQAAGLQAEHTRGVDEARAALRRRRLVP